MLNEESNSGESVAMSPLASKLVGKALAVHSEEKPCGRNGFGSSGKVPESR